MSITDCLRPPSFCGVVDQQGRDTFRHRKLLHIFLELISHITHQTCLLLLLQLYDKAVQSGGVIDVARLLAESQKPWAVDDYQYQFHGAQVQSIVVSASAAA
jgi:hypothetical protein